MSLHSLKLNEVKDNSVSGNYAGKTCCGQPISHVVEQQSAKRAPVCSDGFGSRQLPATHLLDVTPCHGSTLLPGRRCCLVLRVISRCWVSGTGVWLIPCVPVQQLRCWEGAVGKMSWLKREAGVWDLLTYKLAPALLELQEFILFFCS